MICFVVMTTDAAQSSQRVRRFSSAETICNTMSRILMASRLLRLPTLRQCSSEPRCLNFVGLWPRQTSIDSPILLGASVRFPWSRTFTQTSLLRSSTDPGSTPKESTSPNKAIVGGGARHEMIYTVPNFLTFTRLLLSPVLGYLIVHNEFGKAFGLFVYMGATDFIDGYIARRFNQRTMLGTVLDPLADKVLMSVLTIALTSADRIPCEL